MRISFITTAMMLILTVGAEAATYTVLPDGTGDYATIQDALDAAVSGDVVELGPGSYYGPGNTGLSMTRSGVTLASPGRDSFIDGEETAQGLYINSNVTVEGVRFINCYGSLASAGIRIYNASPVLIDVTVEDCVSEGAGNFGGGIYIEGGNAQITGGYVSACSAFSGGGISIRGGAGPVITGLMIASCSGGGYPGGGVHVQASSPSFVDCLIRNCSIANSGGGVYLQSGSTAAFTGCEFRDNTASSGGAVYVDDDSSTFDSCVFRSNVGTGSNGAVAAGGTSTTLFTGCTFYRNSSAASSGSAINVGGTASLTVENSILSWGLGGPAVTATGGTIALACCDVYGNEGGDWVGVIAGQYGVNSNISADPMLIDPWVGDMNIALDSLCGPYANPGCGRIGAGFSVDQAPRYAVSPGGTGWFATIQDAVDHVSDGSIVILDDGTYTGPGNRDIDLRGKLVSVEGRAGDPALTVIDAEGSATDHHRVFLLDSGEPVGTSLAFLTLRGGYVASSFSVPVVPDGGAVRMTSGSSLEVRSCRFEDNRLFEDDIFGSGFGSGAGVHSRDGGSLTIIDCVFGGSLGEENVYVDGGVVSVTGSTFGGGGGVTTASGTTDVVVSDCVFDDFDRYGVYCTGATGSVVVSLSSFTDSDSDVSGGLRFQSCPDVLVESCSLSGLTGYGGLGLASDIVRVSDSHARIIAMDLSGCQGSSAVTYLQSTGSMENCTIDSCSLGFGGTDVVSVGYSDLTLTGCRLSNNSTGIGSALGVEASTAFIELCTFTGNTGTSQGGGARFEASTVDLSFTEFSSNTADVGGGVFGRQCGLTVTDCVFDGNSDGLRHTGSSLGGVSIARTSFLNHAGGWAAEIDSMLTRPVEVGDCLFDANVQGLKLERIPDFRVARTDFLRNTGNRTMTVSNSSGAVDTCSFIDNVSSSEGGALYLLGSNTTLTSSTFSGNASASTGGAIHMQSSGAAFAFCGFEGNHATTGGGALALIDGSAVFGTCFLTTNTSDGGGSCLDVGPGGSVDIVGSTLAGNGGEGSWAQIYGYGSAGIGIDTSIIAFGTDGPAVLLGDDASSVRIDSSDVFGNAGGDWTGPLEGLSGTACNFGADPEFCDPVQGDWRVAETSPCAVPGSPCGSRVGAGEIGCSITAPVSVEDAPTRVALVGNSPNPFNPITEIRFELPTARPVELEVFDASGRIVRRLVEGETFPAGRHGVIWDGTDERGSARSSGVYFYRLRSGSNVLTGKMALIR